jgi:hypothetical protein
VQLGLFVRVSWARIDFKIIIREVAKLQLPV